MRRHSTAYINALEKDLLTLPTTRNHRTLYQAHSRGQAKWDYSLAYDRVTPRSSLTDIVRGAGSITNALVCTFASKQWWPIVKL